MRITQEADYAIRIIYELASNGKTVGAADIAEYAGVTQRFALKILHKLHTAGLVKSYKGVNGGYALEVSPDSITVKDVIETIDGPFAISRCLNKEHICTHTGKDECTFHKIFETVNEIVEDRLSRVTIADVISKDITTEEILNKIKS